METYRLLTRRNADLTAEQVAALWALYRAGEITEAEFIDATAATVDVGRARAVGYADVALAALLLQIRGDAVPLGLELPPAYERLTKALPTLLQRGADPTRPDPAWLLGRLARSEPLEAGQQAMSEGLRQQRVPRWRRVTGADPCPGCRRMSVDTVPASISMWTHKGCSCVQQPLDD